MIRVIIFDLWGTLAKSVIGAYIERVNHLIGAGHEKEFTDLRKEWYKREKSEEDFFAELLKKVKNPYLERKQVLHAWNAQVQEAELFPEVREVLEELKRRKIKLVLASNTVPTGEKALERLGIHHYFDLVLFSFREGSLKQEKTIFKKVVEYFHMKPQEMLFVDDQLDAGREQAEALGMHFVLVDREEAMVFAKKIKDLHDLFWVLERL